MSTMDKIKAKVENVLHSNNNNNTTTTTTGTTTGTAGTTGNTSTIGTTNRVPEGTAGPHNSRIANAADPRVDSDLDGRGGVAGAGTVNTAGTAGTAGTVGATGTAHHHHHHHHHDGAGAFPQTGAGYGTTGTTTGTTGNTTVHSSNLANKLDPRVDATTAGAYDGTHAGNTQSGFTGTIGGISNSANAGPHDSNLANKLDPRVDSDLDGRGNRHGAQTGINAGITGAAGSHATPGSGTAQNTAGPHNSDLANKLDPRVDADLDGSRTLGGNRTYN